MFGCLHSGHSIGIGIVRSNSRVWMALALKFGIWAHFPAAFPSPSASTNQYGAKTLRIGWNRVASPIVVSRADCAALLFLCWLSLRALPFRRRQPVTLFPSSMELGCGALLVLRRRPAEPYPYSSDGARPHHPPRPARVDRGAHPCSADGQRTTLLFNFHNKETPLAVSKN
jgi:hypothetical protein